MEWHEYLISKIEEEQLRSASIKSQLKKIQEGLRIRMKAVRNSYCEKANYQQHIQNLTNEIIERNFNDKAIKDQLIGKLFMPDSLSVDQIEEAIKHDDSALVNLYTDLFTNAKNQLLSWRINKTKEWTSQLKQKLRLENKKTGNNEWKELQQVIDNKQIKIQEENNENMGAFASRYQQCIEIEKTGTLQMLDVLYQQILKLEEMKQLHQINLLFIAAENTLQKECGERKLKKRLQTMCKNIDLAKQWVKQSHRKDPIKQEEVLIGSMAKRLGLQQGTTNGDTSKFSKQKLTIIFQLPPKDWSKMQKQIKKLTRSVKITETGFANTINLHYNDAETAEKAKDLLEKERRILGDKFIVRYAKRKMNKKRMERRNLERMKKAAANQVQQEY